MQDFCVYVRPLLEFSSQVWSPHHKYLIDKVESVQRFLTKRLSGIRGLSYCERLNILGFQILECRHFISDLTLCYNILHALCDTSLSINLSNRVTRASCRKLVKPTCSSDIRKYFFTSRVIDVCICLNDNIVTLVRLSLVTIKGYLLACFVKSPSISVFKKRLSGVKFDRFLADR